MSASVWGKRWVAALAGMTLWLAGAATDGSAEIYKHIDERGNVSYSDRPPAQPAPRPGETPVSHHTQALDLVKRQPNRDAGTVDAYLNRKGSVKAVEDLGWHVYPSGNGGYEVERLMLLNQTMKLSYKWQVDRAGNVRAINGKAIGITHR